MTHELYQLLKMPIKDTPKIINIVKSIDLASTYGNIDLLTFSIFYQHKPSFHILLNRGININPTKYKDIPPLLWALEIDDTYYLKHLLKKSNLNIFHKSENYSENLLSNSCLKLHDIKLFRRIFRKMERENPESLNGLILTQVKIGSVHKNPISICLHYLNSNIENSSYFPKMEDIALEKIKTICEYTKDIKGFNIVEQLLYQTNLCDSSPNFVKRLLQYLQKFPEFKESCLTNKELFFHSIFKKSLPIFNLLLDFGIDINGNGNFINNESYLYYATSVNNLTMVKKLIQVGIITEDFSNSKHSLIEAIKNNNLEIVKELHNFGYSLDQIIPISHENVPKYHRPIHIACSYGSNLIIKYIQDKTGDSLDYAGLCSMTPQDVLMDSLEKHKITDKKFNLIITPEISFSQFQAEDKLGQTECCISLEPFYGHRITTLECGHAFHSSCLERNMRTSDTCPCCRTVCIVKNHFDCKLGKVLEAPVPNNKKVATRYLKRPVTKPKHYTYEDCEYLRIIQGSQLKEYEELMKKEKHKIFLEKMEIMERPIRIVMMRQYLQKMKIGMKKKRRVSPLYNSEYEEEEYNPPNSPIPVRKNNSYMKRLRSGIDTNNILYGVRKTRGITPDYLINSM